MKLENQYIFGRILFKISLEYDKKSVKSNTLSYWRRLSKWRKQEKSIY
jgi:hypothetical protein